MMEIFEKLVVYFLCSIPVFCFGIEFKCKPCPRYDHVQLSLTAADPELVTFDSYATRRPHNFHRYLTDKYFPKTSNTLSKDYEVKETVDSIESLGRTLKSLGETCRKVTILSLLGHGTKGSVTLGKENYLALSKADKILELSKYSCVMDKDAVVSLVSCNAGEGCQGRAFSQLLAYTLLKESGGTIMTSLALVGNGAAPWAGYSGLALLSASLGFFSDSAKLVASGESYPVGFLHSSAGANGLRTLTVPKGLYSQERRPEEENLKSCMGDIDKRIQDLENINHRLEGVQKEHGNCNINWKVARDNINQNRQQVNLCQTLNKKRLNEWVLGRLPDSDGEAKIFAEDLKLYGKCMDDSYYKVQNWVSFMISMYCNIPGKLNKVRSVEGRPETTGVR